MNPIEETEYRSKWRAESQSFLDWGEVLTNLVIQGLEDQDVPVKTFLKVPAEPRLKDEESLIAKAFYRNKNYPDPWTGVEDKVGTRFVVLLERDTDIVCEVIKNLEDVDCREDRNPEELTKSSPSAFDYVATHFVCRSTTERSLSGRLIPKGIPCEIQVRTILQHAWSEVSHDTIYKPDMRASVAMQRSIAKSGALIEATNDYFEKVKSEIENREAELSEMSRWLRPLYSTFVKRPPELSDVEGQILDALEGTLSTLKLENPSDTLKEFLETKPHIGEHIASHAEEFLAFKQPSILLVYFLATKREDYLRNASPLPHYVLKAIFSQMGREF